MQVPLQIAFHNLEHSEAVKELIEEKVAWLERFHNRITSCRVVVEAMHWHNQQGNPYLVRIELTVPGGEIVVNREAESHTQGQALNSTIREAFEVARRRLEERAQRQRKDVKRHEPAPAASEPRSPRMGETKAVGRAARR
jgi:ribosomal subunit interface protein